MRAANKVQISPYFACLKLQQMLVQGNSAKSQLIKSQNSENFHAFPMEGISGGHKSREQFFYKDDILSEYFEQYRSIVPQLPPTQTDELEIRLANHGFKKYSEFQPTLTFSTLHTYFQSSTIEIKYGYYSTTVTILNTKLYGNQFHKNYVGEGKFGKTYSIEYNNKFYAVKEIKISSKSPLELFTVYKQVFMTKFASVLGISPNFEQLYGYDIIINQDTAEFVMELCQINFQKRRDPGVTQSCQDKIYNELLSCLSIMHAFSMNHCDIKVENIAWSTSKSQFIFLDFGFASFCASKIGRKALSNYRGSYIYTSPEMKKLYFLRNESYIDLYFNDLHCLNITKSKLIEQIHLNLFFSSRQSKKSRKQNWKCIIPLFLFNYFLYSRNYVELKKIVAEESVLLDSFHLLIRNHNCNEQQGAKIQDLQCEIKRRKKQNDVTLKLKVYILSVLEDRSMSREQIVEYFEEKGVEEIWGNQNFMEKLLKFLCEEKILRKKTIKIKNGIIQKIYQFLVDKKMLKKEQGKQSQLMKLRIVLNSFVQFFAAKRNIPILKNLTEAFMIIKDKSSKKKADKQIFHILKKNKMFNLHLNYVLELYFAEIFYDVQFYRTNQLIFLCEQFNEEPVHVLTLNFMKELQKFKQFAYESREGQMFDAHNFKVLLKEMLENYPKFYEYVKNYRSLESIRRVMDQQNFQFFYLFQGFRFNKINVVDLSAETNLYVSLTELFITNSLKKSNQLLASMNVTSHPILGMVETYWDLNISNFEHKHQLIKDYLTIFQQNQDMQIIDTLYLFSFFKIREIPPEISPVLLQYFKKLNLQALINLSLPFELNQLCYAPFFILNFAKNFSIDNRSLKLQICQSLNSITNYLLKINTKCKYRNILPVNRSIAEFIENGCKEQDIELIMKQIVIACDLKHPSSQRKLIVSLISEMVKWLKDQNLEKVQRIMYDNYCLEKSNNSLINIIKKQSQNCYYFEEINLQSFCPDYYFNVISYMLKLGKQMQALSYLMSIVERNSKLHPKMYSAQFVKMFHRFISQCLPSSLLKMARAIATQIPLSSIFSTSKLSELFIMIFHGTAQNLSIPNRQRMIKLISVGINEADKFEKAAYLQFLLSEHRKVFDARKQRKKLKMMKMETKCGGNWRRWMKIIERGMSRIEGKVGGRAVVSRLKLCYSQYGNNMMELV